MDFDEEVKKMESAPEAKKKRAPSRKSKPAPPPDSEELEEVKSEDAMEVVAKPTKPKKKDRKRAASTQVVPEEDEEVNDHEDEDGHDEDEPEEEGSVGKKSKKKGGKVAKKEEVPLPPELEAARPKGDNFVAKPKRDVTSIRTLFYRSFNKKPGSEELYKKGDDGYDELDKIKKAIVKEHKLPVTSKDLTHEDRQLIHAELVRRCPNYNLASIEFEKINNKWKKDCEKWKAANKEMYDWTEACKNWRKSDTSKRHKKENKRTKVQLEEALEKIAALEGSGNSSAIVVHSGRASNQAVNYKGVSGLFKARIRAGQALDEIFNDIIESY